MPSRRTIAALAVIALFVAATWLLNGADERHVNAACGRWLEHRDSLRTAVSESQEALGRARAAHDTAIQPYYNDLDATRAALESWHADAPRITDSLDLAGSSLERGATQALMAAKFGLDDLHHTIDDNRASEVADWLPEAASRLQNVDDICLAAARTHWWDH